MSQVESDPARERGGAKTVSIVVPAFNEALAIGGVVAGLKEACPEHEIIVVDDGSTDGTSETIANVSQIRIIRHKVNSGYGSAWKTGIRAAAGDVLVFFDGDGQFDPADVERLVRRLREEDLDMVVGARVGSGHTPVFRRPGKWLLGETANFLTKQKISDLNCGLRAVRKEVISRYLHLYPDGFSASTTATITFLMRRYAVAFEPIEVRQRVGVSTVSVMRDGFGTLVLIGRLIALFDPLRIFLPIAVVSFLFSIAYSLVIALVVGKGVPVLGGIAFLFAIFCFLLGLICDQVSALRLERYE